MDIPKAQLDRIERFAIGAFGFVLDRSVVVGLWHMTHASGVPVIAPENIYFRRVLKQIARAYMDIIEFEPKA
jgi:hypothetical protein